MSRSMQVELTTLCLIKNIDGKILVQDRKKKDWPGWTFPGGHVEKDENILDSVIREIKEETGLIIKPRLVGIAEWLNDKDGSRELASLFVAQTPDELPKNTEQPLFWVTKEELVTGPLAGTLDQFLPIFFEEQQFFFQDNSNKNTKTTD